MGCTPVSLPDTQHAETPPTLLSTNSFAAMAQSCSGCHQSETPETAPSVWSLSGYEAASIAAALLYYRNDDTGSTVMHRIARGYTEEQIHELSAYIAGETQ